MSTNVQNATPQDQPLVTRVFSFGYGHTDPFSGASLAEKCLVVRGPSAEACRAFMNRRYNRRWACEYDSVADAGTRDGWMPGVIGVETVTNAEVQS
jgi:hypothetical protein